MKKIYFIVSIFGLLLLSACNLNEYPKFEAEESFVAFSKTSITVDEDAGVIEIPVVVASLDGTATTATYEAIDGTAKNGVNFRLVDGSGTVSFAQGERTQTIKIEIIDHPDNFTGDLDFSLQLKDGGDVKLGGVNTCTVRITDLDHPLANILGVYNTSGTMYWDGPSVWETTLIKDEKDVSIVWFRNLANLGDSDKILYYGIANLDNNTITIPLGQLSEFEYEDEQIKLIALSSDFDLIDEGEVVMKIGEKDGKPTIELPDYGIGGYFDGSERFWDLMLPGMIGVRK